MSNVVFQSLMKSVLIGITNFLIVTILTGCTTPPKPRLPERGERFAERQIVPVVPDTKFRRQVEQLADLKRRLYGETPFVFSLAAVGDRSLPANAPDLPPLMEQAFSRLSSARIHYVPPETMGYILATPEGTRPFVEKPEDFNPILIRISARTDRDQYDERDGLTLQALMAIGQGYVQPEFDWEIENTVDVVTVGMTTQSATGALGAARSELTAQLARQRVTHRIALIVFGSGGNGYRNVAVSDGLGGALDAMISQATVVLVGRATGLPYWLVTGDPVDPEAVKAMAAQPAPLQTLAATRLLKELDYPPSLELGLPLFLADRGRPPATTLTESIWTELFAALKPTGGRAQA